MSIIVAYKNDNGIILAADSKAFNVGTTDGKGLILKTANGNRADLFKELLSA